MPTLRLHRFVPLKPSEIGRLPGGTVGVRGTGDVVARVEADGSLEKLLTLAFRLGQAVPDARLSIEGATGVSSDSLPEPTEEEAEEGREEGREEEA